jgi:hypothetical protein
MKSTKIAIIAATAILGVAAIAGAAVKANASSAPAKGASPAATAVQAAEPAAGLPDTDNVQQGDQATPDATAAAGQSNAEPSEAAGEAASTETATNSDGPGGHADEPGNANADHQFQGEE